MRVSAIDPIFAYKIGGSTKISNYLEVLEISSSHLKNYTDNLDDDIQDMIDPFHEHTSLSTKKEALADIESNLKYLALRISFTSYFKLEEGVTIDATNMEVIEATSIQKKNIHEGAKVTLNFVDTHKQDPNCVDYITWIKLTNHKIDYIEETVESSGLDEYDKKTVKEKLKEETYGYVNKVASAQEPLDFDEMNKLTDAILTTNKIEPERTFIEHINEYHSSIPNLFKPYDGATKNWEKIKATVSNKNNKKIRLIIDREILNDQDFIDINDDKNEITIKQLDDSFFKDL
ncbi:hypothetical protein GQR58_023139 [Nymphon striatum]|nr:hypothetical protein GQR58_023139 [Nymphon striatum]